MTDNHNQSFFGQSTGMLVQSSSKHEPFIFLQFILYTSEITSGGS